MRAGLEEKLFSSNLIDDMHTAFEAVCRKLGLAATHDKATELVATKIVELAKAGLRGEELTDEVLRFFGGSMSARNQRPTASDAGPSPATP
jgi:hypothetical protein